VISTSESILISILYLIELISWLAHFEITGIDKNIGLNLAVTPLTESRDKFLCLVLQLPPEMRTDGHQQIISKLTNVIQ